MEVIRGPSVISSLPQLPLPDSDHSTGSFNDPLYHSIQNKLYGKELLLNELEVTWEDLHPLLESGIVSIRSGLLPLNKTFRCHRCYTDNPKMFGRAPCSSCGSLCTYCRHCIMMGKISTCTPLLRWNGPSPVNSPHPHLKWEGTLTKGQLKAAQALKDSIEKEQELLIWAVCGAGKTEILFPGLQFALSKKKRVLVTSPRTDVVLELMPRMQKAFPNIPINGLYGGGTKKDPPASLVIATTHQTMRFTDTFDVVVIDEVDAFPFHADDSLLHAVYKSKKNKASIIYLTATPSEDIKQRVANEDLSSVVIPRRFHGHPLPVPRFQWSGSWQKDLNHMRLPKSLQKWCAHRIENGIPALLFVPTIEILEKVTSILKRKNPHIQGVHSKDIKRHQKVSEFREGVVPLLVTTTILERGITIPGVDVAVLGSEDNIFTESALVQIAGRAGRSSSKPHGDVVFFHFGKTKAMKKACQHIVKMNRREEGK
ncbi:DEAD/DEAH box helicase [Alteribacillus iranensis]|nr:DEAD/DEAH box helicase [Alteribacillus iranensis]